MAARFGPVRRRRRSPASSSPAARNRDLQRRSPRPGFAEDRIASEIPRSSKPTSHTSREALDEVTSGRLMPGIVDALAALDGAR